tara:strand:+ start:112 stop:894 length:783 start_codon:yes stop_codon:yes gene_type:complete
MNLNKVKYYWNKQPCNIKFSKKKIFSKEYFNEVKKKKYFVEKHIRNFAEFKKYKNKNVLEIGCGIGTDAIEFIKNNAKYTGIDYSEKSINIVKKRVKVLGLENKNPNIFVDNAEKLNLVKKLNVNFDLIYSFGVIHHTPNMQNCFNSIYKISNKNTEIKIMLYAENSYKNMLLSSTPYRFEAQKGCPIVYKMNIQKLNKLIKNKFKILDVNQDFIFPYKIKPYKNNKFIKIDHFQYMPKKIFQTLEKNIGEHMLIKLKKI